MKKLLALFICLCFVQDSSARLISFDPITGKSTTDIQCIGGRIAGNTAKANTEICLDSKGSIVPTTTNAGALGNPQEAYGQIWIGSGVVLGTASGVYIGTGVSNNATNGTGPILSLAGRMFTSVRAGTAGPSATGASGQNGVNTSCGNWFTAMGSGVTFVSGSDFAGIITLGTGISKACTIEFSDPFVNTPICSITLITTVVSSNNGTIALNPIILPTSIQFNTSLGNPGFIDYICVGQAQ